ncbi:MAG TPA: DUF2142 domain-containing protein [Solirubrobacteraceae bacterium]|nr:DUF2142 domain-containing protein [Solirubrobacteraceae bacterium]
MLIVGVPCLGWCAYSVLRPRDYFTGTNSVIPTTTIAEIAPGHRACVPGLQFPAGTGRVRVAISTPNPAGAPTFLRADVAVDGARLVSHAQRTLPAQLVDFSIPRLGARPASVPGGLCLTNLSGAATLVGGYPGHGPGDALPRLDGRPLDARVAVWFAPPAGQRRSLVSLATDIFARAALFRPGFVGRWTYWLVVALLLPVLALASLRLLAGAGAGVSPRRIGLGGAIAAIAVLNALAWSLITPPWDAPDEQSHYAYTQYLAETGRTPHYELVHQRYSSLETAALEATRFDTYHLSPQGRPPWLVAEAHAARVRLQREAETLPRNNGGVLESGFYKPAYYALTLPAYYAGRDASVFDQLWLMRLVSVLLAAVTAACTYALVRELFPGSTVFATGAGLLVALQPMIGFMSGVVNNDAGIAAGGAALLYLLVRGLRRGLTARLGVAIGLVLALLPLLKSIGYALYLPAALAIGAMLWRQRGARARVARGGALVGAFAVGEVVWGLTALALGTSFFATPDNGAPGASGLGGQSPLSHPFGYLSYLWQVFLPRLPGMTSHGEGPGWAAYTVYVKRGWADFGWVATTFPDSVYVVIATVMFTVGGLGVVALWRERRAARARAVELAVLLLAVLAVVAAIHAAFYRGPSLFVAEAGREAFAAFAALAVVVVGACVALGRRRAPLLVGGLVTATAALSYASALLVLSANFS